MPRSPSRNRTASIGRGHGKINRFKEMDAKKPHRLWSWQSRDTRTKGGGMDRPLPAVANRCSGRVVHLELDGVRGHAEALHLVVLERDVRVEHVAREDAAAREELAVVVQVLERFVERRARV